MVGGAEYGFCSVAVLDQPPAFGERGGIVRVLDNRRIQFRLLTTSNPQPPLIDMCSMNTSELRYMLEDGRVLNQEFAIEMWKWKEFHKQAAETLARSANSVQNLVTGSLSTGAGGCGSQAVSATGSDSPARKRTNGLFSSETEATPVAYESPRKGYF